MAALPTTAMAHQHGASQEEIAETVALAVYMAVDRRRSTEGTRCALTISLSAKP